MKIVSEQVCKHKKGHTQSPAGARGGSLTKKMDFGRNRRKSVETAQPMRQKAIQSLLSQFRWSPRSLIFGRFEPGSLSTFFQNMTWKFEKSELWELKIRDFEGSKNGPETSKSDS